MNDSGVPKNSAGNNYFSVKVWENKTKDWHVWIGVCKIKYEYAGVIKGKRSYWKSAHEIKKFFYKRHASYLKRYKFALFTGNKFKEVLK